MAINLHPGQSQVFEDLFVKQKMRFSVVCCARGWGKSYMAGVCGVTAIFELLELDVSVPHKVVYIIAPTYDQVVDIYYPLINYELGMEHYALHSSRDAGRFIFPKKVELRLLSYESVERIRGKGAYFVVWDEVSSCRKGINPREAWQSAIQPAIITRWSPEMAAHYKARSAGRGLAISTPKGYNYFHDMYNYRENNKLWGSYHYDYTKSPFIDPIEVEQYRHEMDPIEFASEYLASFKESGNSVFYCFDRNVHVKSDIPYFEEGETVHCAIDFNVGIQATSFNAIRGNQIHTLDEIQGHPDTETLAGYIKEKFKGHKIVAYPDPTGRSRKTSAAVGITDFKILESPPFKITCFARPKSPGIMDSVAAVNRKLKRAAGEVDYYIHPRCTGVIKSLERTIWMDKNPETATIDKTEGYEHFSDGIRYMTEYLYPIRTGKKVAQRGFNF